MRIQLYLTLICVIATFFVCGLGSASAQDVEYGLYKNSSKILGQVAADDAPKKSPPKVKIQSKPSGDMSAVAVQQTSSSSSSGGDATIHGALKRARAQKFLKHPIDLENFYEARQYAPFWIQGKRVKPIARDMLGIIEDSWTHGLNPRTYHLEQIKNLMQNANAAQMADLDLYLSDGYLRLAQDLTGIRIDPSALNSHTRFWKKPLRAKYLLGKLRDGNGKGLSGYFESLAPQGMTYKALQKELVNLAGNGAAPYEQVLPINFTKKYVRPNDIDARMPDLRVRLGGIEPQGQDIKLYDDRLAAAVIRFQRENGLQADGVIGPQTLRVINQSPRAKIEQLIANLERLRWVEDDKPEKFVVVNIPSATLWAVEDGAVAFDMPVVVGRSERPTNIFRANIDGVRLNPNWTVPPTIKKDDILPELQKDPHYLETKGMQLIRGFGKDAETIDPLSMDWAEVTPEDLKNLQMIQKPGANNPLGRIRVLMPNSYNIYLHDTNEAQIFNLTGRAVSSGCVRMKNPERMAQFILAEKKGWDDSQLEPLLDDGKLRNVYIDKQIPVYMLYYTVWLDPQGALVYGQDLYDLDQELVKILKNIDGIFIPVDNT